MVRWLIAMLIAASLTTAASPASAASAVAFIDGHGVDVNGISSSAPTLAAAKKRALTECIALARKKRIPGTCKVKLFDPGPAYLSIVFGDEGVGYAIADTQQEAVDKAYKSCTETTNNCQREHIHWWHDSVAANEEVENSTESCRPPTGKVLRSETHCVNGDCVRKFENGCTVHFQAAYCFDPIQQKYDWRPDGC